VYNDLEQGRWSLAVSLSEDEGKTWPWTRHLERDPPPSPEASAGQTPADATQRGEYHYPSIIQARDGTLHATYSYFKAPAQSTKDSEGRLVRKTIKHAHFNEAWIRAGN
jgi:predicted neuraminidase